MWASAPRALCQMLWSQASTAPNFSSAASSDKGSTSGGSSFELAPPARARPRSEAPSGKRKRVPRSLVLGKQHPVVLAPAKPLFSRYFLVPAYDFVVGSYCARVSDGCANVAECVVATRAVLLDVAKPGSQDSESSLSSAAALEISIMPCLPRS